jgi:F-type H+-transporting ATPase subunit delta
MAAVAGRYARAFAEVIVEQKADPRKVVVELNTVAELVSANAQLHTVFQNPAVDRKQKLQLLDAIIKLIGGSRLLRNFVAVLIDHRRIGQIAEISRQFQQELNERLGIAEAKVLSARELAAVEKQLLENRLATISGKVIQATYAQESSLIGGAVVRMGSTIYDGSVRGQLERIKQEIARS